jgi:predicted acetyltransferase
VDIDIRPVALEDYERFVRAVERAFGHEATPQELETWRGTFEPERTLAAFDQDDIVGTTAAFSMDLSVPGAEVPMAGITAVGVAPTHRRRGLLTSMMRRQLDDVREGGREVIAGLWASEGAIYGRFGYGASALTGEIQIERQRTAFARPSPPGGRMVLVDKDRALELLPPIHDRMLPRQPGMWARPAKWWKALFADLESWREGASHLFFAVHESPNGFDGYAAYRIKSEWEGGFAKGSLRVLELIAENPQAYADVWRYCFDVDLIDKIEAWPCRVDEPLFHMLLEPRRLNLRIHDGLWLRLVDVPSALAARRYSVESEVVVEVRDSFCPWNEGRFEVHGGPDGAACRPTKRSPGLAADAADLAAAYLGGVRFSVLERAGRVHELEPGALAAADLMFGWDPLPWCPRVF